MSQATLADMVGTTRSRINYFITKFERLGFIDTNDGLTVNRSLLGVTQEITHAR
jgi:ssDNA-specific exonuclease RecJ